MKCVFKLPEGVQIPDGKEEGETFQAMGTFKLMAKGEAELIEVDNEPLEKESPETADTQADDDSTQSGPSLQDRLMGSMANPNPGS